MPPSLSPEEYTVGWICAIPTELQAAKAMLDETHAPLEAQPKSDENNYTLGRMGKHNIVFAILPSYGTNNAAIAGKSMQNTFPNLRFGLMVGVGGGIPSTANDIRLGDIVVSAPNGQNGGVIQYDLGKEEEGGFRRVGHLNSPPTLLQTAINTMQTEKGIGKLITKMVNTNFPDDEDEDDEREWRFPERANDELILDGEVSQRRPRKTNNPRCFYGTIGSGNRVIKSAKERQDLAEKEGLICFEMEAAGLMNFFKCIVIRGICDYADKHKHKEWQPYAAAAAAAYAKILLSYVNAEAVAHMDPIRKNRHWMVPRQVNPHFTGRTHMLRRLRESLCSSGEDINSRLQKRFVIRAMGGSGKSEVCLKFANENRDRFWGIFWIDASDEISIKQGLVAAAKRASGTELAYGGAKLYFEGSNKSWLLIYDNADKDIDYFPFFPSGNAGTILMTTRLTQCQQYNNVGIQDADFEKLGADDSLELLRKTTGLTSMKWSQSTAVAALLIEDDYLCQHALAITQAGAFVNQGLCKLEEYPAMFQQQRQELLKHYSRQAKSEYGDVYATFEVTAQAMMSPEHRHRQDWIDALRLLQVLAFMYREGVSEDIFLRAWSTALETINDDPGDNIQYCSPWQVRQMQRLLRQANECPNEVDITALRRARSALQSFSLITVHPDNENISMHPLVYAWAKDRMQFNEQALAWALTASILSLSLKNRYHYHDYLPTIQPHIAACIGPRPQHLFEYRTLPSFEIVRILYAFAWVAYRKNNNDQSAAIMNALCSRIGSREVSPQTHNWRHILYLKALCQGGARDFNDAMQSIQQVISYDDEHFAPDSADSLVALVLLGILHQELGEVPQAIKVLEKVVQTRRQLFGPADPDLLVAQHNLASAYRDNNQISEGLAMFTEVTQVREKTLSPTHPSRLVSQHALGVAYLETNQIEKAIEELSKVVKIREEILLPKDPVRLTSEHELGRAYCKDNQFEKAYGILENVVEIRKTTLKPTDRELLASEYVLAYAYNSNGEYGKALPLIRKVVEIQSLILKPDNKERIWSEELLADVLSAQAKAHYSDDKYEMAMPFAREAFKVASQISKSDGRTLHYSKTLLAYVLYYQAKGEYTKDNYQRALPLIREAVEIVSRTLEPNDENRITSASLLHEVLYKRAREYYRNGDYENALPLLREAVQTSSRTLGPDEEVRTCSESLLNVCLEAMRELGINTESISQIGPDRSDEFEVDGDQGLAGDISNLGSPSQRSITESCSRLTQVHVSQEISNTSSAGLIRKRKRDHEDEDG